MSFPTTLLGHNDGSLTQTKRWFKAQYPNHRFIMDELDDPNGIHVFKKFEEEGFVERFECHFMLVDTSCDALFALAKPAI